MLSHTSGLPDALEDRLRGAPSLVEIVLRKGDRELQVEEIVAHVRERLRPHFPPQPAAAARPRIRYSDTNFVLLGEIVRAVAAAPLHRVLDELVLRPPALRDTSVVRDPSVAVPDGVRAPAALVAGDRALELPKLLASTNAVYSSTADLIGFMSASRRDRALRGLHRGRAALNRPAGARRAPPPRSTGRSRRRSRPRSR